MEYILKATARVGAPTVFYYTRATGRNDITRTRDAAHRFNDSEAAVAEMARLSKSPSFSTLLLNVEPVNGTLPAPIYSEDSPGCHVEWCPCVYCAAERAGVSS